MIQELSFKNFFSFKDEVKFSFEASNDTFAEESQVVTINENTRLLRFAVVYGYNASGKSNLLLAFSFLRNFWTQRPIDSDSGTKVVPFKLNKINPKEHSFFDIVFYVGTTKYSYHLELDATQVYREKLLYYKTIQPIMLFDRVLLNGESKIQFGPTLKVGSVIKERIEAECLKNTSVFVARNQVNASIPLIDDVNNWLKTKIMESINFETRLTDYAQNKSVDNPELKERLLIFLSSADFNISKIKSEYKKKALSDFEIYTLLTQKKNIPFEARNKIIHERIGDVPHTNFMHSVENDGMIEEYALDLGEESTGTLRTFGIETALYEANKSGSFLTVDEIETSLHSKLLEDLIYDFLKEQSESQIIITTHNDSLLDLADDLIRKDSIWFVEKQKNGSSNLYKLVDFTGVNRLSSIRSAYRNKRFGATQFSVK